VLQAREWYCEARWVVLFERNLFKLTEKKKKVLKPTGTKHSVLVQQRWQLQMFFVCSKYSKMRIFCIGDHICLHWQLVILRNLWRNIERLNKPFVCGSVVWKMLGFVLGQSLSYFTCMNKDENLLLKCKLRVSYSRIHCKPSQKAGKRLRRTSRKYSLIAFV